MNKKQWYSFSVIFFIFFISMALVTIPNYSNSETIFIANRMNFLLGTTFFAGFLLCLLGGFFEKRDNKKWIKKQWYIFALVFFFIGAILYFRHLRQHVRVLWTESLFPMPRMGIEPTTSWFLTSMSNRTQNSYKIWVRRSTTELPRR